MGVVREFSHFLTGPACDASSLGCFFFFWEKMRYFQPPSVGVWLPSDKKWTCVPPTHDHAWDSFQIKVERSSWSYPLNDLHLFLLLRLQIE